MNILNEIKQTVTGIGDSKGRELFLKFIAKDMKEIEEIDGQQQYEVGFAVCIVLLPEIRKW